MKPMEFAPITHFYTKINKSNRINTNSNRHYGLSEDEDEENKEYEEKLAENGKEKMNFLLQS